MYKRQQEIHAREILDSRANPTIEVDVITEDGTPVSYTHLGTVESRDGLLIVNGRPIKVVAERDPSRLPWKELGVDIVIESTGLFASMEKASAHLQAGARKVIISCPAKGTKSIVMGVNQEAYDPAVDHVIDNASCRCV